MRILVLGATGMVGHVMADVLRRRGHEVLAAARRCADGAESVRLDITDRRALDALLGARPFDAVVNCAGVLVTESECFPARAVLVNAWLPRYLSERFAGTATRVVQLSTDCVFSGAKAPYDERSAPDAASFYGRTKALGELENGKDLTVRMSVVGPELWPGGTGLFHWFMGRTGDVPGYTRARWTGVTSPVLAECVDRLLTAGAAGLCHAVPPASITKYELLCLFADAFDRSAVRIVPDSGLRPDRTLLNTRPELALPIPSYAEMVKGLRVYMDENRGRYAQYVY